MITKASAYMNSIFIDDTTLHLASWRLSIRSISFADRLKTLEQFNDVGSKLSNDEISEIITGLDWRNAAAASVFAVLRNKKDFALPLIEMISRSSQVSWQFVVHASILDETASLEYFRKTLSEPPETMESDTLLSMWALLDKFGDPVAKTFENGEKFSSHLLADTHQVVSRVRDEAEFWDVVRTTTSYLDRLT